MSAFSLMGVGKLLGMLELIKLKIAHAPKIKALATIFDKRTKYSQTMLTEIQTFFKDQMLHTVVRTSVALKRAAMAGVPVTKLDKDANGAKDHIALAREILKLQGDTEIDSAIADLEKAFSNTIKSAPTGNTMFIGAEGVETGNTIPPKAITDRMRPVTPLNPNERTFLLNQPGAKNVHIVGEFNNWKISDETKLSMLPDGKWQARITLQPGKYRYKFVVDGQWILDSQNPEKAYNQYGTLDSVIKV